MKKFLSLLLVLTLVVSVFAGCAPKPTEPEKPVAPTTPTTPVTPEVTAPGPNMLLLPVPQNMADTFPPVWDNYGGVVRMMMYSRLMRLDLALNPVYYDLAKEHTVSDDGLVYTFTLNDAKWHDGQALTAEDVAFSVKAALLGVDLNAVIRGAFTAIDGAAAFKEANKLDGDLKGMKVEGNKITFTLSQPSSTFLLCTAQFNILPKHLLEKADMATFKTDSYWANPIGSGPYMVKEFVPNDYALLEVFPDYFGAKPVIQQVKLSYMTEADYVVRAQADEIDYFQTMDSNTAAECKKLENYTVKETPIYFIRYLMWNSHVNDNFKDVRVREAILHALNREDIATKILKNGVVTDTKVPAAFDYYWTDAKKYDYNVDTAKKLLAEAKFDASKEMKLSMYYSDQTSIDLMDYMVQALSEAGIKASYTIMTGDITSQLWLDPQYDFAYAGLSAMSVEEAYNTFGLDSILATNTKNIFPTTGSDYDELVKKLNVTTDPAARKTILIDLQKVDQKMLWNLPICTLKTFIIYNSARIEIPDLFSNDWSNYERGLAEWKLLTK